MAPSAYLATYFAQLLPQVRPGTELHKNDDVVMSSLRDISNLKSVSLSGGHRTRGLNPNVMDRRVAVCSKGKNPSASTEETLFPFRHHRTGPERKSCRLHGYDGGGTSSSISNRFSYQCQGFRQAAHAEISEGSAYSVGWLTFCKHTCWSHLKTNSRVSSFTFLSSPGFLTQILNRHGTCIDPGAATASHHWKCCWCDGGLSICHVR
jgi:hypothetical protein